MMKSLRFFLIVTFGILSLYSYAQESSYDISKYKLPDINYNELNFKFNLSNTNDHLKETDFFDRSEKSKENNFNGMADISFLNYRNTQNYQGSLGLGTMIDKNLIDSKLDDIEIKDYYTDSYTYVKSENRAYFYPYFFEINPSISYEVSTISSKDESISSRSIKNGYTNFKFSSPIGFGFGRIEAIQDARLAVYILEELLKNGSIERMPDNDFINRFSEKISEIKNSRFFDVRLRDIEDMKEINRFLRENDIIKKDDIDYYTVLRDEWDYSSVPLRFSGYRFTIGIDNSISNLVDFNDGITNGVPNSEKEIKRNYSYYGPYCKFEYEKPHDLYWQSSAIVQISRLYPSLHTPIEPDDFMDNYKSKLFLLSMYYGIDYIPDSRTYVNMSLRAEYIKEDLVPDEVPRLPTDVHLIQSSFFISPGIDINYYISPQIRLNLKGSLRYLPTNLEINYEDLIPEDNMDQSFFSSNFSFALIFKLI